VLFRSARRTALDRLRLETRRPTLSDSNDPTKAWQAIPDSDGLSDENRWRSIHFALQALSPEHRQVLELAYYQVEVLLQDKGLESFSMICVQ